MKLSIIVPVYNMAGEGKLSFCLDSLMAQEVADYEVIAVDDASTDNSLQILREYERRFPDRFRVAAHEVNRRQGGAKNTGLGMAKGEWVGFVDSDDWVSSDCYRKLLARAEETGADLVGCDYSLVTEQTFTPGKVVQNNTAEQTGILDEDGHRRLLLRPGSMVIKIYQRKVLTENDLWFPEDMFYEDNCAGSLWSLYFHHFEKVEEPLYFYYQHDNSTVHTVTEERCWDRMQAAKLLIEECRQREFLDTYHYELEYRFTELYYVNTLFSYLAGAKRPKLKFVRELREGMVETFPHFQGNPYYDLYVGEEEKRLISLQEQSDRIFYVEYFLRKWVRTLKKSVRKKER